MESIQSNYVTDVKQNLTVFLQEEAIVGIDLNELPTDINVIAKGVGDMFVFQKEFTKTFFRNNLNIMYLMICL